MPEDQNRFLMGGVYSSKMGMAAIICTVEGGVLLFGVFFCDDQVLVHCRAPHRRSLFTPGEWAQIEGVLSDPSTLPIHAMPDTQEPIVLSGGAAGRLYASYHGYNQRWFDDVQWFAGPPRIIGFLYLDVSAPLHCDNDYTLILAMKISEQEYRVFVCYTTAQVRAVLDAYALIGFDRAHYDTLLARSVLDDSSTKPMVTIGEGESATIAYHLCLWIETNRALGNTSAPSVVRSNPGNS